SRGMTAMAKQQTSKQAKTAAKVDTGAANKPAQAGERQTRRRAARALLRTREALRGASAAVATLPAAVADNSAMSTTDNEPTERTASQSKPQPKRAVAAAAKGGARPPASTKRAMLIGMLERAEGASVTEIGKRLGWLPHTVRAAIAGLHHAGREVARAKDESGQSVYRPAPLA